MAVEKSFESYLTDDNLVFLENEHIRIGVNLSLGGALTYLAEKGKKTTRPVSMYVFNFWHCIKVPPW